jgi:hypothetical protein
VAVSSLRIQLPNSISGASLPYIMPVELNTFNSDILLPALYYRVLAHGRNRGGAKQQRHQLDEFITRMLQHPLLQAPHNEAAHEVLKQAVRTFIIATSRSAMGNSGEEQILTVLPHTLLAYRPGFPAETSQLRRTDAYLYRCIVAACDDSPQAAAETLRRALGRGLTISSVANGLEGGYDGISELDTVTRLSIAFIESVPFRRPDPPEQNSAAERERLRKEQQLPRDAAIGRDILAYISAYAGKMPAAALGYDLQGLMSMELLLDSLQRMQLVSTLVAADGGEVPDEPRRIYVDWTDEASSLSAALAAGQVWRDLELGQHYMRAALQLYQLERYLGASIFDEPELFSEAGLAPPPADLSGLDYYRTLLRLSKTSAGRLMMNKAAREDEAAIRAMGTQMRRGKDKTQADEDEDEASQQLRNRRYDQLLSELRSPLERAATLIQLSQIDHFVQNFQQWYLGAGGLQKPHGLVRGRIGMRQTWRYAPGNDLLAILVQLAAARQSYDGGRSDGRISLRGFLQFLEQRFGMLVDRPPREASGPEYNAAARDNLRALQRRLQQMGMFDDLSDDFTVQQLQAPYFDGAGARGQS